MRPLLLLLPLAACITSQQPGEGPIQAPADEWTWVYFDDARCADGSRTGLAVQPHEGATDVVIFLLGGGACWDQTSCDELKLSLHLEGYGARKFDVEPARHSPLFDRASSDNPAPNASYVFIPYCTGDLHVGTGIDDVRHHVGAKNLDAFLNRIVPTFPEAKRVLVTGTSAGGYGAQLNAARFVKAFEGKEVHLLADSAPLVMPATKVWERWTKAWQPSIPEGCDGCANGAPAWAAHARKVLGDTGRYGVIVSEDDLVIQTMTAVIGDDFRTAVGSLIRDQRTDVFVVPGPRHTFVYSELSSVTSRDGAVLSDWMRGWATASAPFATPR